MKVRLVSTSLFVATFANFSMGCSDGRNYASRIKDVAAQGTLKHGN